MSPIAPSDYVALHRAILDDPDSDAPRLALAVWYERNGKAVRGQLLRQEVKDRELVRAPLPEALDGRAVYRRGFIDEIILNLDTFMDHVEELFGDHPITRVEFIDLEPVANVFGDGTWGWITGFVNHEDGETDRDLELIQYEPGMVPEPLADALDGPDSTDPATFTGKVYSRKSEAVEALSRAAVSIGRVAAGLSRLPGKATLVGS
jgi:uncharacterized protein (TIGR02996 family)